MPAANLHRANHVYFFHQLQFLILKLAQKELLRKIENPNRSSTPQSQFSMKVTGEQQLKHKYSSNRCLVQNPMTMPIAKSLRDEHPIQAQGMSMAPLRKLPLPSRRITLLEFAIRS
jgi:hypothetical protein